VDDANLYSEGNTYEEAYDGLRAMLLKEGGAKEWSQTHQSRFEKSKLAVVGFSRRRVPDPARPGKTMREPRPDFEYEGAKVPPSSAHKFLGVYLDEELRWKTQAEKAVAKAVKWTLLARRLSKPSTGVRATYMRQLYCAVAIPKFTYAADIWFTPVHRAEGGKRATGSVGVVRKLTSVQRLATIAITGAMRTTASDTLEAHANVQPIELLLAGVCFRAASRMMTLPKQHPLYRPVRVCARRLVKKHPSPIHQLTHRFGLNPATFENINPFAVAPDAPTLYSTEVADSREESKEADDSSEVDAKIYTDGSGIDGYAGAAAVLYKRGRRVAALRYRLGSLATHTTYEAEAIGVVLALQLLGRERSIKSATILLDNQGVIQAVSNIRPRPAQYILGHVHHLANKTAMPSRRRRTALRIAWISGHDNVAGNEEADSEARKAAAGENSQVSTLPAFLTAEALPCSLAAARQAFRTGMRHTWRGRWERSPRYARTAKIDDSLPSSTYLSHTANFTRAQHSLITQLRTGHAPLNKHLHRIKKAPSPVCPACHRADETTHHFLFDCRAHEHARYGLRRKLGRKATSIKELLGKPDSMVALLRYVAATERLKGTFGDVSPPPS
jgi:ribonuclease HI